MEDLFSLYAPKRVELFGAYKLKMFSRTGKSVIYPDQSSSWCKKYWLFNKSRVFVCQ